MTVLGYMSAQEALENGFTHHGKYYGIPLWLAPDNPDFPVATKWAPMELVMTVFHAIEPLVQAFMYPEDEPSFMFSIGQPIVPDAM